MEARNTQAPGVGRAAGVAYLDRVTRQAREVRGKVVVLCASTLESTRLLLHSAPGGLANSSGALGRYLMDHIYRGYTHGDFPELPQDVPFNTTADHENYIARLRAFSDYADGTMELMRAGVAAEKVLPAVVLEGWEKAVDAQIVDDAEQSLFYKPFKKFPTRSEEHTSELQSH